MYQPHHFRVDDIARQAQLIKQNPLGLLITTGADGLVANPVPFVLDQAEQSLGVLRCHVARANPQWQDVGAGCDCLVVFQDRDFYVTPSWYATKAETSKVVPTWNYMTVHAWGQARAIEDADWLQRQIRDLTDEQERPFDKPWEVDDAPENFVAAQVRGIVGIEITVSRSEGKWKMSQNRPERDRLGVRSGLESSGHDDLAKLID